ncbi:MAG TPA: MMPL family transporter, partial [Solirubrobacteraceae bacterium]|nr:MMPL family transporter [Solirubrobacteraceae bacterium]
MESRNLAARAGRWSAHHRKAAILGWIAFVVLAVLVGGKIGQNDLDESAAGSGESKRGDMIVAAAGFPEQAGEQVLIQGRGSLTAEAPEVTAAVRDVTGRLQRIDGVTDVERPLHSADGRSVLVSFALSGSDEQAEKLVEQPLAAVAAAQHAHPDVRVEQFGEVSATKAIAEQDAKDGNRAHLLANILMLIILLAAFGAVVAAGLPLVLGATAVAATVGLLGPVSRLYALPADVAELVIIIGLAVGVDYAMFYARRVMEERDRGQSVEAAVERAAATSGRAVLISGMTVLTAMAGLLFAGNPIFVGFGVGTMLVVAMAVLGSLTFLPAMLAFLSSKNWLEKGRVPFVAKRRHAAKGESRVWAAVLQRVLKRPLVSTVLAAALLVALTIPALGMQFKNPGFDGYSRSQPVIQTHDRLQAAFPGGAVPATVVVKSADVSAAPVQEAIGQLHDRALATGQLAEPSHVEISPDKTVAVVGLSVLGSGTDAASERSLETLRSEVVPATVGKLAGAEVAVSGVTASSKDFNDSMLAHAPLVFAFVLALAFILLL